MSDLNQTIGTRKYDQILADPQGADIIGIPCTPGKGKVESGTLMFRESTGMYSPAAAENITATNMIVVLKETTDTGLANAVAEDAAAYRAGNFIDGRVTLAAGAAVTAAHKVILRQQNIVFTAKDGAENTVNNKL